MRVQTAHKNMTQVIHTTPVHQFMSCEAKSCMFFLNCEINALLRHFTNHLNWLKYKSFVHIISFSIEKVVLSELGETFSQIEKISE